MTIQSACIWQHIFFRFWRIVFLWNVFAATFAIAQLSPGDLHQSHAKLEGLSNCTKCHSSGAQIDLGKCLDCHKLLKQRIDSNKGLHARPDYSDCVHCHNDHHGRDFEMVFWKEGQDNFDHDLTGYRLEEKHAELKCRDCHKPANIADPQPLLNQDKNLERTFLGLQQACLTCHVDEHRGQLAEDCLKCHTYSGWKPANRFDHDKAKFRLTGLHQDVKCVDCHKEERDNRTADDPTFARFTGIAFQNCTNCHEDVHRGQFGQNCQKCHSTAGWKKLLANADFNHNLTRYPLRGKHATVACESCHKPGIPRRGLAFAKCTDCHTDFHLGQFAARPGGIACENCHTVKGFSPANFTFDDHAKTDYPLEGAHLAIPCIACHAGTPNGRGSSRSMLRINRFTFVSTKCIDCHKDPHFGETKRFVDINGCESCHRVDSWRSIEFDHSQTDFALLGKHNSTGCIQCHVPAAETSGGKRIPFQNMAQDCQHCHADKHNGQFVTTFVSAGKEIRGTDCARCHGEENWQPVKFDHNRDSKFSLEGAHEKVACEACHMTVAEAGVTFRQFKPLGSECSDCHGG